MGLFRKEPGCIVLPTRLKRAMGCGDAVYHVFVGRQQIIGAVIEHDLGDYQARYMNGKHGKRHILREEAVKDLIVNSMRIELWS